MFVNIKTCKKISLFMYIKYLFGPVQISKKYDLYVRKRLMHRGYELTYGERYYDYGDNNFSIRYSRIIVTDTFCQLEQYLWHEYQIEI